MVDAQKQGQLDSDIHFSIQKIYVKDLSFETPNTPAIFKMDWQPVVDMHVTNEASFMQDNLFEVVLSLTLTVKLVDQVAYLAEVDQAGIFFINKIHEDIIGRVLATTCPNILFPFVRETVADIVTRGGFPQILLAPVNFETLYQQQQLAEKAQPKTTH